MSWTLFDGSQAIAASGSYTFADIDVVGQSKIKIGVDVTYHASATAGCHADIMVYKPDGSTLYSDEFVTAVVPEFAAGETHSKLSGSIDVGEIDKIAVKVTNDDSAQQLTVNEIHVH